MRSFEKYERRGLPGGPNEITSYMTGAVSVQGYKSNSPDRYNDFNLIPSGNITMEDVDFPVFGMDNLGNMATMIPGMNYNFPGDMVFELPMAQSGGEKDIESRSTRIEDDYDPELYEFIETSKRFREEPEYDSYNQRIRKIDRSKPSISDLGSYRVYKRGEPIPGTGGYMEEFLTNNLEEIIKDPGSFFLSTEMPDYLNEEQIKYAKETAEKNPDATMYYFSGPKELLRIKSEEELIEKFPKEYERLLEMHGKDNYMKFIHNKVPGFFSSTAINPGEDYIRYDLITKEAKLKDGRAVPKEDPVEIPVKEPIVEPAPKPKVDYNYPAGTVSYEIRGRQLPGEGFPMNVVLKNNPIEIDVAESIKDFSDMAIEGTVVNFFDADGKLLLTQPTNFFLNKTNYQLGGSLLPTIGFWNIFNRDEDEESEYEDYIEIIDPTGLTGMDDAKRAYDEWQDSGDTVPSFLQFMDMFGGIPLLGKAKYIKYLDLFNRSGDVYDVYDKKQLGGDIEASQDFLRNWYQNRVLSGDNSNALTNEIRQALIDRINIAPNAQLFPLVLNDAADPNIFGQNDRLNNAIYIKPGAPDDVYLHELTHFAENNPYQFDIDNIGGAASAGAFNLYRPEMFDILNQPGTQQDYLRYVSQPTETSARLMTIRERYSDILKPDKVVTKEDLRKIFKQETDLQDKTGKMNSDINDLLMLYGPDGMLKLLNEYVEAEPQESMYNLPMAQLGYEYEYGDKFELDDDVNLTDFIITNDDLKALNKVVLDEETGENINPYACDPNKGCLASAFDAYDLLVGQRHSEFPTEYDIKGQAQIQSAGTIDYDIERDQFYSNGSVIPRGSTTDNWVRGIPYFKGRTDGYDNTIPGDYDYTADSWDIHGILVNQGGTSLLTGRNSFTNLSESEKRNLYSQMTPGTIVGFGRSDDDNGGFNNDMGLADATHSTIVVGFAEDGVPILYDYGIYRRIDDYPQFYGNNSNLTNITVPKGLAGKNLDYIKREGMYDMPISDYSANIDYLKREGNAGEMAAFYNGLTSNKNALMHDLKLTDDEYNMISDALLGISMQETTGGESEEHQINRFFDRTTPYADTHGLTQLNWNNIANDPELKRIAKKYDITKARDLLDPEKAAIASMIYGYRNLNVANRNYKRGLKPSVRTFKPQDYDLKELIRRYGQGAVMQNDGKRFITEDGIRIDFDTDELGYSGFGPRISYRKRTLKDVQAEFDKLYPPDGDGPSYKVSRNKDGDIIVKKYTLGNIELTPQEQFIYNWNNPTSLRTGDARGESNYLKNIDKYIETLDYKYGGSVQGPLNDYYTSLLRDI